MLSEDCMWSTLYLEKINGRAAILAWMKCESQEGRKNMEQGTWSQDSLGSNSYTRDVKVTFPSKATHDVVQTVTLVQGQITEVMIKPLYPALSVALAFAEARSNHDDEASLDQMSQNVEWKAWDGFHVEGKEAVRKLFRQQKGREVVRQGRTEFEAATVNEHEGVFERLLDIERVDGIKVKTKQMLFVRGELSEMAPVDVGRGRLKAVWGIAPKIVEVHVLTTEEFVDGKWVKSQEDDHF